MAQHTVCENNLKVLILESMFRFASHFQMLVETTTKILSQLQKMFVINGGTVYVCFCGGITQGNMKFESASDF